MKSILLIVALLFTVAVAATDFKKEFAAFKAQYGRTYVTSDEEEYRYEVFVSNMLAAAGLQASNPSATFGVNKFSDLTAVEFKKMYHNADKYFQLSATMPKDILEVPVRLTAGNTSVDWRAKGAVTYVRDQGSCGGCWSFSAVGNIEGQWFLKSGTLVPLSEQQLISCDPLDSACNGGLEYNAWKWLISSRNGQIFTEASYPYTSGKGTVAACSTTGKTVGATITSYKNLQPNETVIATFMYTGGPVSIGVDATSWQSYKSGILTNCISRSMDHSVLAVGYDDTNVPPYWIVKNSWGTSWGEAGYIRLAKGSNQCLMANDPSTSLA